VKIMEQMSDWLSQIYCLHPTTDELASFCNYMEDKNWAHGVVSYNTPNYTGDQSPRIHDTYGQKMGGRCHIDMGFIDKFDNSVHIMLGRHDAPIFIKYIRESRGN
jgi:hypothetical protein